MGRETVEVGGRGKRWRRRAREKLATTTKSSGAEKVAGEMRRGGGVTVVWRRGKVGAQVHLTRTGVVRACGRRINRCHHGDRTSVARRHGVIPRSGSTFATPSPAAPARLRRSASPATPPLVRTHTY